MTHDEAREWLRSDEGVRGELLRAYVDQQEAAERERATVAASTRSQVELLREKMTVAANALATAIERAETAERECERMRTELAYEKKRALCPSCVDPSGAIEQARAEGYERGKREAHVGGAELVERLEKLAERVEEREQDAYP